MIVNSPNQTTMFLKATMRNWWYIWHYVDSWLVLTDYELTVWLLWSYLIKHLPMCFVYIYTHIFFVLFFNCDIRTLISSAQLDMTASSSTWMTARGHAKKSRISWRPGEKSQSLPPSLTLLPQTLDVLTAIDSGKPSLVHSHITKGMLQ